MGKPPAVIFCKPVSYKQSRYSCKKTSHWFVNVNQTLVKTIYVIELLKFQAKTVVLKVGVVFAFKFHNGLNTELFHLIYYTNYE